MSRQTRADVTLAEADQWTVYTNGRVNVFASHGWGDGYPEPLADELVEGAGFNVIVAEDTDGNYRGTRIRSGFMPNVLGFGLKRKLDEQTQLGAYVALWIVAQTPGQVKWQNLHPDAREAYLKLESPYGDLLAGRALGIFGRGSAEIDFLYGHGFGLGSPCDVLNATSPGCGHIGYGVLYPGFAPGIVYDTPREAGLGASIGVYDPVRLVGWNWERTPLPRLEGEVSFEEGWETGLLKVSVNGVWQRLGYTALPGPTGELVDRETDVYGVSGAARLELDMFKLGVHAFRGQGVGLYYALENAAYNFFSSTDHTINGQLRNSDGAYVQAALIPKPYHVALGAGVSRVHLNDFELNTEDPNNPGTVYAENYSPPMQQIGLSAAFYYHFTDNLVWGADVFRASTEWYQGEEQTVWFVNTGITAHW